MRIEDYPTLNHCMECGELGPHMLAIGETRFWLCDDDLLTLLHLANERWAERSQQRMQTAAARIRDANDRMLDAGLSMLDEAMR